MIGRATTPSLAGAGSGGSLGGLSCPSRFAPRKRGEPPAHRARDAGALVVARPRGCCAERRAPHQEAPSSGRCRLCARRPGRCFWLPSRVRLVGGMVWLERRTAGVAGPGVRAPLPRRVRVHAGLRCGVGWGVAGHDEVPRRRSETVGESRGRSRRKINRLADHRKICKEHAAIDGQLELTLDPASNENGTASWPVMPSPLSELARIGG
jgi:hypothetical protein